MLVIFIFSSSGSSDDKLPHGYKEPRHDKARERARSRTRKSLERMKYMYDKKHQKRIVNFEEGDFVTVIAKEDRASCEMKRLPAKIVKVSGVKDQ